MLKQLKDSLPNDVHVTVIADRGFASDIVYEIILAHGFDYIIRFKGITYVEDCNGVTKKAKDWLSASGQARTIRDAKLTDKKIPVNTITCYREKGMKSDWCIASSRKNIAVNALIKLYAKRRSIECSFRDLKNDRYGF